MRENFVTRASSSRAEGSNVADRLRSRSGPSEYNERGPTMLIISTIYFANLEAIRDPLTNKVIKNEVSDLEGAERKVVVVYAGSPRDQRSGVTDQGE